MSKKLTGKTARTTAKELELSAVTLRRWADEFVEYLSEEAGNPQNKSQRRYDADDLVTLNTIKDLVNNGLTYEQIRQQLATQQLVIPPTEQVSLNGDDDFDLSEHQEKHNDEMGLVASNSDTISAATFLTNSLAIVSDNQKSILNSQAANRELLGVLIQDNFNLKEENSRLNERILEIERNISQNRQDEEWRREALRQELDSKIGAATQLATEAVTTANTVQPPEIKAVKSKPGCLGSLFGGGEMQIVTIPNKNEKRRQAVQPQQPPTPSYPAQSTPPSHPKPTLPPE